MMTASATTEEELHQHSSSPSPHLPSNNSSPNFLLLPSTPLLSSGRWSPSSGGLQSSQQENRRGPLIAVATAAEAVETKPVNSSNCAAVTVITTPSSSSSCPPAIEISSSSSSSCPVIEISSSNVINPPSLSETSTALVVVRHSSCDPGAPPALI